MNPRNWLTLTLTCVVLLWVLIGCTTIARPIPPPISMAPTTRPALVDEYESLSKEGRVWIQEMVNVYLRNCITLKVLRGESPQACEVGIR